MIYLKTNESLSLRFGEIHTTTVPDWHVFYSEPATKQNRDEITQVDSFESARGSKATAITSAETILTGPTVALSDANNGSGSNSRRYKCRVVICNRDTVAHTTFLSTLVGSTHTYLVSGASVPPSGILTVTEGGNITVENADGSLVSAPAVIADNVIVRGDGGVRGVQGSGVTIDDSNNVTGMTTLTLPNTGLHLAGALSSVYDLILQPSDGSLTADRTLSLNTRDGDKTLTLGNNLTADGTGNSVLGRAGSTNGSMADIVGATAGDALMNVSGTVGFNNFGALTTTDLAVDDEIPFSDTGSSGANKNTTVDRLLGFGPHVFGARLTLTTAVPVTMADVTGAATIYLTPHNGNRVRVYDGTRWKIYALTEKSLAIGTLSAGDALLPHDIFLYDNAGTLTLEKLAWSSSTARATALTTQDGVYVKTGDATRLYVGSFRPTSTTTTADAELTRRLWNAYNRTPRKLKVIEGTNSWNYTTNTYRQVNAAAGNQVDYMCGIAGDPITLQAGAISSNSSAGQVRYTGIGIGSTSVNGADITQPASASANEFVGSYCLLKTYQPVGYQYYAWLEKSTATGTSSWYGDNGDGTSIQSGMIGECLA